MPFKSMTNAQFCTGIESLFGIEAKALTNGQIHFLLHYGKSVRAWRTNATLNRMMSLAVDKRVEDVLTAMGGVEIHIEGKPLC